MQKHLGMIIEKRIENETDREKQYKEYWSFQTKVVENESSQYESSTIGW